jgi:hypothetical protein
MGIWTGLTSACQDLASHVPALARAPTVISSPGHRRSTPSAIPAWPSSPVWVLMYWRGTLSTSHVHTGRPGAATSIVSAAGMAAPAASAEARCRDRRPYGLHQLAHS